jgi:hypothetical protein
MSKTNEAERSRAGWIIAAALLVGAGGGLWLARQHGDEMGMAVKAPAAAVPADDTPAIPRVGDAPQVAPPTVMMAENGRLSVELSTLRDGDIMAIGLGMPDEARGEGPRPVRVVDIAGRAIDAEAWPIDGAGTGLRLEIDPDWLRPGRYMIQVQTAEQRHMALRRYVVELTEDGQISE